MRPLLFLTFIIGWLGCQPLFSQDRKVTLRKNLNIQAKNLHHSLNPTQDTLLLSSTSSKINYVYTINRQYKREVNTFIDDTDCKLALNKLSTGKHVVVVGQNGLKIVFVIEIEEDNVQPTLTVASSGRKED